MRCSAMPPCRGGCLPCCHQLGEEGPAAPAGLHSFAWGAAPCHRAGCGFFQGCRQRVREGLAKPAGLTSLTCVAASCHRARCGYLRCCLQHVRRLQQHQQALFLLGELLSHAIAPEVGDRRVGTCLPARHRRVPGWDPAAPGRFADAGSCYGRALRCAGSAPVVSAHRAAGRACARGQTGQQALQHRRAGQHHDIAPEVLTYSAAIIVWESASSMTDVRFERCGVMPSCRM